MFFTLLGFAVCFISCCVILLRAGGSVFVWYRMCGWHWDLLFPMAIALVAIIGLVLTFMYSPFTVVLTYQPFNISITM